MSSAYFASLIYSVRTLVLLFNRLRSNKLPSYRNLTLMLYCAPMSLKASHNSIHSIKGWCKFTVLFHHTIVCKWFGQLSDDNQASMYNWSSRAFWSVWWNLVDIQACLITDIETLDWPYQMQCTCFFGVFSFFQWAVEG